MIPFIALGMALQGVYLLTSIGLNLTSRTEYYPVATFAALIVGLGSGVILMPRFGVAGAAIAFLASTITQTSVALVLSRRFYPVTYEDGADRARDRRGCGRRTGRHLARAGVAATGRPGRAYAGHGRGVCGAAGGVGIPAQNRARVRGGDDREFAKSGPGVIT